MTDLFWRFSIKSSASNAKLVENTLNQFSFSKILTRAKPSVKFVKKITIFATLLIVLTSGFLDLSKNQESNAQAAGFGSSWASTINSISNVKTSTKNPSPKYSYQNPFLEYPNLNQAYLNDPENTVKTVAKIDKYIQQNRSRDSYDTSASSPVSAAFYYETAIKYHVPIDQMLAVARSESRFGTDCYSGAGNPTRICLYKNIFSIGLTESSSLGFESWEKGVESFGRLYQSRKNRGFDDCQIWSIYNPNGNYCGKILTLASTINGYISNP